VNGNSKLVVTESARVNAPPDLVYAIIADFRERHPRILPKQFSDPVVETGGVGAGTIIRYRIRVWGRQRAVRSAISEPAPGRVLVETVLDGNGAQTIFTVNPGPTPGQSVVSISTEAPVRSGLLGAIERALASRFLRPIYREELALLAGVATRV
jgi:Polyketide cyclase / dehydrase and lipid transport